MLNDETLYAIKENKNTGIEYEIALFYVLLQHEEEKRIVNQTVLQRIDSNKIRNLTHQVSVDLILSELRKRSLRLVDVLFTTQDDTVGPADIVMIVQSSDNQTHKLGISVKYANTCTLNATGRKFLSESQISKLKKRLPEFTQKYVSEMQGRYGSVNNWFRKRLECKVTDEYIDLIRDEVLLNWVSKTADEKRIVLREAYHATSPIQYWVFTFQKTKCVLDVNPYKIDKDDMFRVEMRKYETSYIGFYLDNQMIGKMQVKFNNGFIEKNKSGTPDIVIENVAMKYGRPFSSWNFSLV